MTTKIFIQKSQYWSKMACEWTDEWRTVENIPQRQCCRDSKGRHPTQVFVVAIVSKYLSWNTRSIAWHTSASLGIWVTCQELVSSGCESKQAHLSTVAPWHFNTQQQFQHKMNTICLF